MKSHIDSRTVGIQQPRDGEFLLFNKSGSKVHISGLLYSLLQWKKKTLLACVQGTRRWGGKGEGALARRQADCWLYLLVCFFFLVYQPQKGRKQRQHPPGGAESHSVAQQVGNDPSPSWWELPSRDRGPPILTRPTE